MQGSVLAPLYRALAGVAATVLLLLVLAGASLPEAPQATEPTVEEVATALHHPLIARPAAPGPHQVALAEDVARRFRIANDAAHELVGAAVLAGQASRIDPMLVLAVIAVESRFNPIAESDYGARGLMQVVARFHFDKLPSTAGERALLDPWTNIDVGTRILREYMDRTPDLESALQLYGGASEDPERVYAKKVFAELERFKRVREAVAGRTTGGRAL
jgi:soluble lytic murein transglycosylase-like protein